MAKEFNISYYTNKISSLRALANENSELEKQAKEQQYFLSNVFCDDIPVDFFNHKRYFHFNESEHQLADVKRPHKLRDCKYLSVVKGQFGISERFQERLICTESHIKQVLVDFNIKSLVSESIWEKIETLLKRGRDFLLLKNYDVKGGQAVELSIIRLSN